MNMVFSPLRNALAVALLAALLIPAAAVNAQQQPSSDQMQKMQALGQQIQELHKQAHVKMLAAITPQHRKLVAKLKAQHVGEEKGAKMINAALTPREVAAVLAIDSERRTQEHKLVASVGGGGLMLQEGKPDAGQLLLDEQHLQLMTP
jgi:hypothetical protein